MLKKLRSNPKAMLVLLVVLLPLLGIAAYMVFCPGATPTVSRIDEILNKGDLTVAVVPDAPPFSVQGPWELSGFEIDLMYEFARRWFDDADPTERVKFIPVTYGCRIHALRGHIHNENEEDANCEYENEADIIAAQLTWTKESAELVDFSSRYLIDGQRLLVPTNSDIEEICDLGNRPVAVLQNTTIPRSVTSQAEDCIPSFTPNMNLFASNEEAIESVKTGESAGFVMDSIALETLIKNEPLKLVGLHFSPQPYGLGLPKGDDEFVELVNKTLCKMEKDGTLVDLYYKYSEQFGYGLQPPPIGITCEEEDGRATTDVPPIIPERPDDLPPTCPNPYVVLAGDSLSVIAGKCSGDPSSWNKIHEENRGVIGDNPNNINLGMELNIPDS